MWADTRAQTTPNRARETAADATRNPDKKQLSRNPHSTSGYDKWLFSDGTKALKTADLHAIRSTILIEWFEVRVVAARSITFFARRMDWPSR